MTAAETAALRDEFVALWSRLAPFWGVTPAAARVYGWLLSRAAPADAETLGAGLGMSRGAVSMACKELADWGLLLPERASGSRRVRWRPESDAERAIRNIVAARKRREWDPILERVRSWIPRLRSDRSADGVAFRERLEDLESLVGTADALAQQFLQGGVVARLGLRLLVGQAARRRAEGKSR